MVLTRNQRMRMMTRMMRNRTEVVGVDRLSELPDALLYHIFSFIDTKYIVRACVLSKRYQFLWHSLAIFQFDQKKYRNYHFFVNFIIEVLSHCDVGSKIHSFSLDFVFSPNLHFLRKLLRYVLSHEPQHLRLNIGLGGYFSMNPITSSESLETLHAPCGSINGSFSFNFPILTTLFLEKPILDDGHCVFSTLFSGCPNLKDLTLYRCISKLDAFSVVVKQLEKLDISIQSSPLPFKVVIEGPKLHSLKYKAEAFVELTANVPLVEKVDLSCVVKRSGHWKVRLLNIVEILQQFQHSKYLYLGSGIIQVLTCSDVFEKQFPLKLCNLTLLELKLPSEYNRLADVIVYLLRHSPAEVLNGKKLWEEILESEGTQERTYFIDESHRVKVMTRGKHHIQIKINYQLIQGWNSMYENTW